MAKNGSCSEEKNTEGDVCYTLPEWFLRATEDLGGNIHMHNEFICSHSVDRSLLNQGFTLSAQMLFGFKAWFGGLNPGVSRDVVICLDGVPYNDVSNLLVLCPTHHRIVHVAHASFLRSKKAFAYPNGLQEKLKLNLHL